MARKHLEVLLITANVGSIFEDPEHTLKQWMHEFLTSIKAMSPEFIAIHCQEVGGKNYEESMQYVNAFVKGMLASDELQEYDRVRVFLDEDFTAQDKFTALGNLYFIHESVKSVETWDFDENKFVEVEGKDVLSGNIESVPIKEKRKFPQHFFPDFRWSRKGFIRTRWSINNLKFDLINIHLFHDASNILAMETAPSVYVSNRNGALRYTLEKLENDELENVPYFMFGDFNFRLDTHALVKDLTQNHVKTNRCSIRSKKNDEVTKIIFKDQGNSEKPILTVGKKDFHHHLKHEEIFLSSNTWLRSFDKEVNPFYDKTNEFPIHFPPTYPFSEDIDDGRSYMKTRCPAWCDRILYSHSAKEIIIQDSEKKEPEYYIIGENICMGDHKPVYLKLKLRINQPGNLLKGSRERVDSVSRGVSINGEIFPSTEITDLNIHDYAKFEKEEHIIPEFRQSLKTKSLPLDRSRSNLQDRHSDKPVLLRRTFSDYAKEIVLASSVLHEMKRRRWDHHSDSDDSISDNESVATDIEEIVDEVVSLDSPSQLQSSSLDQTSSQLKVSQSDSIVQEGLVSKIMVSNNNNAPNSNNTTKVAPEVVTTSGKLHSEIQVKPDPQSMVDPDPQDITVELTEGGDTGMPHDDTLGGSTPTPTQPLVKRNKSIESLASRTAKRSGYCRDCPTCVVL